MRRMWIGWAAVIMASAAWAQEEWETTPGTDAAEARELVSAVRERLEDVSLLNLINGLYLTPEQMPQVLELARRAGRLRDEGLERHAAALAEFRAALDDLRARLLADGPVPADVETPASEKEHRILEARRQTLDGLRGLEQELRAVLSPVQARVAEEFNPCLIPPKDLKDPVRVGEAGSETADLEDHLETVRTASERAYPAVAGGFAELLVSMMELHLGKFDPEPRAGELARMQAVFDRVRRFDDVTFHLEKSACANDLLRPIHERQGKAREITEFFVRAGGGLTKVGKYLLNPRIIPLLEKKARREPGPAPVDLDAIDPAESCHSCGKGESRVRGDVAQPGPEPRFSEVAAWLGLDDTQAGAARAAFVRAQRDLIGLLAEPRADGRNLVLEVFRSMLCGDHEKLVGILGERAPDGEDSYLERIADLKDLLDLELLDVLSRDQHRRWRRANIDPFKVKARR